MGRGLAWDSIERQVAAKAYVTASENSVNGADQKTQQFSEAIHRYVQQFAPPNSDPRKFSGRLPCTIYDFLKTQVFPDVQKFSAAINMVKKSLNTGNPSEADIHCMAIAHYFQWTYGADPNYMMNGRNAFNPSSKWENYLAFLELRKSPKFFVSPSDSVKKPNVVSTSTTTDNTVSDLSDHEGKHNSDDDKGTSKKQKMDEIISIDCEVQSRVGQKRAKLALKEKQANEEREKHAKSVSNSIASIASSQAGMYHLMQISEHRKNLKMLKEKYNEYKQFDREKAMSILSDIDKLENLILNFGKENKALGSENRNGTSDK
jgi:hypothetical protein